MTSPLAPYGLLDVSVFPFPALAALAGRLPLGGARETALACLLCARLVHATLPPYRLAAEARRTRAAATGGWLRALPLSPALHDAAAALCTAAATVPPSAPLGEATRRVLAHADPSLDSGSRDELRALAARLDAAGSS